VFASTPVKQYHPRQPINACVYYSSDCARCIIGITHADTHTHTHIHIYYVYYIGIHVPYMGTYIYICVCIILYVYETLWHCVGVYIYCNATWDGAQMLRNRIKP